MRDHTTASNGSLDQSIQLLVSADGELEMTGGYSFDLEVLASVASELQHLSSQVLENSS